MSLHTLKISIRCVVYLIAVFAFGLPSFAGEVDQTNITVFTSGAPIVAAEVNQTLQALITAIDDSAQRIAVLEMEKTNLTARIADLEMENTSLTNRVATLESPSLQEIVSGSTYRLCNLSTYLGYHDSGGVSQGVLHGNWYGEDVVTFHTNGTYTTSYSGHERWVEVYNVSVGSNVPPATVISMDPEEGESDTITGTWSLNGSELTIPGEGVYYLSPDGNTFLGGHYELSSYREGDGSEHEVSLYVGVRLLETAE